MARMPALVLASAMLDPDGRMTAAELAEFLHISAGSVSGAVRMLTQVGFLRRERERGTRRDVFVVEDDAWRQAMLQREQTYAPLKQALALCVEATEPGTLAHRRVRLALEFLHFVERELAGVMDRWEEHKNQLGLA